MYDPVWLGGFPQSLMLTCSTLYPIHELATSSAIIYVSMQEKGQRHEGNAHFEQLVGGLAIGRIEDVHLPLHATKAANSAL